MARISWNKGKKLSLEHKIAISYAHIGKKRSPMSMDTKKKIGEAQRLWRTGKKFGPHSKEWNKKISKSLMGHPSSEKARLKLFKGDMAGYHAFHKRVYKIKGKANYCASCGLIDIKRKYFWANLTGKYQDVNDYMSMCMPCHMRYDYKRRLKSGKKTSTIR